MTAERIVEELDKSLPHIMAHPLVEDANEELAKLPRLHALRRHHRASRRGALVIDLHDGDELQIPRAQPLQEAIDIERLRGIGAIHHGEGVKLHLVLFQQCDAIDHAVKRSAACFLSSR